MRNFNYFSFLLLFSLTSPAFADSPSTKKMTVGVLVPLSGGPAEQGTWVRQGAEIARELCLKEGVDITLRIEDTQADPKLAVSAFQKLYAEGKLDAVITYGSGVGMALHPLANQDKVIQMGVATSTPAYRSPEDFNFRNFPGAELEADFLVKQALRINAHPKVTIVRINNEYGVGTAKAFRQALESAGGSIASEEILDPGASDYRTIIAKMKSKSPEMLYLGVYPTEGALFLKQAKEINLKVPMLASVAILGAKNFFDLAAGGADNLLVASGTPAFLENPTPETAQFVQSYQQMLKEEPSVEQIYAARAYDGLRALARAQLKCENHQPDCLKEQLFQIRDLKGPSGSLSFDRNGDVTSTFTLLRINGKKFERANEVAAAQ